MKTEKDQFCDVVMKGGVTSGIVYPLAICELAQTYTFKNIGGTSAGAIAAALAAAAEYRRRTTGSNAGFDELAKLPDELSNGALERLFQPQRKTKSLYRLVLCFIGSSPWWWKLVKALGLLFVRFPIGTVLGLLPGIFILVYLRSHLVRPITWYAWAWLGLLLLFLPAFILALLNVVVQALAAIPANNYGLCGGSGGKSDNKPLTDWLSDKIGFIADKKDLSFKDLWSAGGTAHRSRRIAQPAGSVSWGTAAKEIRPRGRRWFGIELGQSALDQVSIVHGRIRGNVGEIQARF